MTKRKIALLVVCIFLISLLNIPLFEGQVEKIERSEREINEELQLRRKIEEEEAPPPQIIIEEEKPQEATLPEGEVKVFIKNVAVIEATLIPQTEINNITSQFINKELTIREMQKIANMITEAYRNKGYVTSRAYLPAQKIQDGNLEIRVVEATTGDIDVKGNRFFKSWIYKFKIHLKKGNPFNYNILRKGLTKINEQPDRNAKAVLMPGKEPGATDILLQAKDRLPIHVGFGWDNFGSKYIGRQRGRVMITHNNLLGFDDSAHFQYQLGDAENYKMLSGRYLFPITDWLKIGFFAMRSRLRLGREYEDLDSRGKSDFYSVYATQTLVDWENFDVTLNGGFDYKDVINMELSTETSRDRLRIAKVGLDFDVTDKSGRTIITEDVNWGIPDIFAGLKAKDSRASRAGAGGEFIKNIINLIRLQKLPFESNLLWKNQMQLTAYNLAAAEQFQIGGVANVRGYPPAELSGDRGYSTTLEWTCPYYFIPKNINAPFSKARLYDALKFVAFYDWANTRLKSPQPGEEKSRTLRGYGIGVRYNVPEDFSIRLELAWPGDNKPSDGEPRHTLFEITKSF